jgi:hypothetical protein
LNFLVSQRAGRPKTAICRVSEKIQTAYLLNTPRALDFIASLHLTILERPAGFRPAVSALTLELA